MKQVTVITYAPDETEDSYCAGHRFPIAVLNSSSDEEAEAYIERRGTTVVSNGKYYYTVVDLVE